MIKEKQIRVLPQVAADIDNLKTYISEEEAIRLNDIKHVRIIRRSIDARHRTVYVNLTVRIYINEQPDEEPFERIEYRDVSNCKPAIVVGAGPAGLFAALRLIEFGIKPIVVERGKNVRERKNDIAKIARQQKVDTESNYSFGEGGAGAYSDGKLTVSGMGVCGYQAYQLELSDVIEGFDINKGARCHYAFAGKKKLVSGKKSVLYALDYGYDAVDLEQYADDWYDIDHEMKELISYEDLDDIIEDPEGILEGYNDFVFVTVIFN